MESRTLSPAVLAGLAAGAAFSHPTYAQALTVLGVDVRADDPVVAFVAGCAAGALVAGGTSLVLDRLGRRHREAERLASAQPTASAGTHQAPTGQERLRHARQQSWEETGTIRVQQPVVQQERRKPYVASAGEDLADVAENYVRSMTLAQRMASRARGVASVLTERLGASHMQGLPVIERADGSVGDVGEKWWDDATGIDEQCEPSLADITAGARPVTETLAENSALLFTNQTPMGTPQALECEEAQAPGASRQGEPAAEPDRSRIAERVASPAEAFPDHDRWSDQERDLWQVALDALDERADEQLSMDSASATGSFSDVVGGSSSLDEPDGLEASTQFLPFRPQAGHPEVMDTESYVDLLINQEFSRNASPAARRTFRDYLTLIDGGTLPGRHLAAQRA